MESLLERLSAIGNAEVMDVIASYNFKASSMYYETPKAIAEYAFVHIPDIDERESVYAYYFDARRRMIGSKCVSIGTIDRALMPPREIFKDAFLLNADSFVLMHNHPSGTMSPSKSDLDVTHRICEGARFLEIEFTDHIIVGGKLNVLGEIPFVSLREAGQLK